MPLDVQPSYASGFARCAAESEYPQLWRGLVLSTVQGLGITGKKFIDLAYRRNGTVVNTGVLGSWTFTKDGPAYLSAGLGSYVLLPGPLVTNDFTAVCRVAPSDVSSGLCSIFAQWASGQAGRMLFQLDGSVKALVAIGGNARGTSVAGTLNAITTFGVTRRGAAIKYYVNGAYGGTDGSDSTAIYQTSCYISTYNGSGGPFFGTLHGTHVYTRALADSEMAILGADFPAPFRLRRRVFAAATAAPPVTGNRRRRLLLAGVRR